MQHGTTDYWDVLSIVLWTIFFALGLVPELAFDFLRGVSAVVTHTAYVNSSGVLTLALVIYLAYFALRRCRESGLTAGETHGRTIQISLIAFIAFLEIPPRTGVFEIRTLLELPLMVGELDDHYLQGVVLLISLMKLTAWFYLWSLVFRYHALARRDVFATMLSVFPSAKAPHQPARESSVGALPHEQSDTQVSPPGS